jgi:hypothetical protein
VAASSRRDGDGGGQQVKSSKCKVKSSKLGVKGQMSDSKYLARQFIGGLQESNSTIVESSLQIGVFFSKRSQFQSQNTEHRRQNTEEKVEYKYLSDKGLRCRLSDELLKLLSGNYQWSTGNEAKRTQSVARPSWPCLHGLHRQAFLMGEAHATFALQ